MSNCLRERPVDKMYLIQFKSVSNLTNRNAIKQLLTIVLLNSAGSSRLCGTRE